MKTFRILPILMLALVLAAGCTKKPVADTVSSTDEACETISSGAADSATVASFNDEAVTETVVVDAPALAAAVLQSIHFDFDQHTLSGEARAILDENTRYMQANTSASIVIEGHCDERGSDEYNLALGERRAIAAKDYIVAMGISPQRISTISYGEEKPLDPAGTEQAWAMNRRAEFKP